jgi:hypothetical protein
VSRAPALRHAQTARQAKQATVDGLKLKVVDATEAYLDACHELARAEAELADAEAVEAHELARATGTVVPLRREGAA